MTDIAIRIAAPSDAPRLLEIYAPYVTGTAITFEYAVPSLDEFRARVERTLRKHPYLVALLGGTIVGYAYAGGFSERPAYDWSVELSIYADRSMRRRGLGRALYAALEGCLAEMGVTNANACIAVPSGDSDPYLDRASVSFHSRLGYREVGQFRQCASKFGRWYDMAWMEKLLLPHTPNPAMPRSFNDVREIVREKYGIA